jgi:hypothetical protein
MGAFDHGINLSGDHDVRWLIIAAGMVVVLLGLLCLNYTKASGLERHRAFGFSFATELATRGFSAFCDRKWLARQSANGMVSTTPGR